MSKLDSMQLTLNSVLKTNVQKNILPQVESVEHIDWHAINNLGTLLQTSNIFFLEKRLDTTYLICRACSSFCKSVEGQQYQSRIKRFDTFPYGLKIKKDLEDIYFDGVGQLWSKFKYRLKRHYNGSEDSLADIHVKGLNHLKERKNEESRSFQIHRRFLKLVLQTVKTKAAADHYELKLAEYHEEGIDVGNIQHSRKNFPELCAALSKSADNRIDSYLSTPLPSTGVPPHCVVTFDKSTVHRETNQAIMIISSYQGHRECYLIDAPLVYSKEHGDDFVSGGQSSSLATQISTAVVQCLPNIKLSACVGAVADGQYQNSKFVNAFTKEFFSTKSEFNFLQWDSAHSIDLVMKKLQKEPYLKRISERSSKFHQKLGLGKMHSITQGMSDKTVICTKPLATTRFISSTIESFKAILRCFKEYITALYDFGGMVKGTEDEYDEEESIMVGQDYIIDLLLIVDITKPVINFMINVQNLQIPCWKISRNFNLTREKLVDMAEVLVNQPSEGPWDLPHSLFPSSDEINEAIIGKTYKGVKLVDGWLVNNNAKGTKVVWDVRDVSDVHADTIVFIKKLIGSLDARLNAIVPKPLLELYKAIDLSEIIQYVSGKYSNALKEPIIENKSVNIEFCSFFNYVKSLPHVCFEKSAAEIWATVIATFR